MTPVELQAALATVRTAIYENAAYEAEQSIAKCQAYVTAVRRYLMLVPKRVAHGGRGSEEHELDIEQLRLELEQARQWLGEAQAATGGAVIHPDFAGFRE